MTERFEPTNEAELTTNYSPRTLGSEVNSRMEEGQEQDITPEEIQITPGEPQGVREARRAVAEAEEELRRQLAAAGGDGEGGGNPPTAEGANNPDGGDERERLIRKLLKDPTRFQNALTTIDNLRPEELKEVLSNQQKGVIERFVGLLAGDDIEDQDKYIEEIRNALEGDISQLHAAVRNVIHDIKEDSYRIYSQDEEPVDLTDEMVQTASRERHDVSDRGQSLDAIASLGRNRENEAGNQGVVDTGLRQMDVLADEITAGGVQGQLARQAISDFFEEQLPRIFDGRNKTQQKIKELSRILNIANPQEATSKLHQFIQEADRERQKNIREGKEIVPDEIESIQDLARFIIRRQDTDLYGRLGIYPLLKEEIDPETHQKVDRFQPQNFLIWLRDQATKLHYDNATSEISFLGNVAIETRVRTISIYMMTRFRSQYFKDEVTGIVLDDLADQALNEAWGFGITRNMDLKYRQVMNSDSKLPEAIVGLYSGNDLTRSTLLSDFSSMPSEFTNDPDKRDTKLGDAFMLAEDIYYNLPDIKELKYVAGENSPMFRKEWFKKALLSQQGKLEFRVSDSTGQVEMEQPNNTQFYDAAKDTFFWKDPKTGYREDVFDGNGRVNEANYYNFINFFLDATPDRTKIAFVRELVRYTIAQEYGINDGLMTEKELRDNIAEINSLPNAKGMNESTMLRTTTTKQKKIQELKARRRAARINLEWAENNSFVTLRPLLVAAKNDTGTRGYDAETKLSTLNYLLRQSGENTAGPIGNPEALGIFRNLSVDTLAGLKTESGLSPRDIYRFIRNLERGGVRWRTTRDIDGTTRRELVDLTRERGDNGELLSLEKALEKNPNTQRVSADELKELKSEYLGKLKFAENAMMDFASNQVNRAYEIFHSLSGGEQLNLGKIVSYDPWKGGVIYDSSAFEELVKDKFLKPMRYAFASNAALNYGSVIRAFVRLKDGQPIFENKLLVDHMFGKDVTDDIKKDVERGKYTAAVLIDGRPDRDDNGKVKMRTLTYAEFVNTSEGRTRLVKNAARARFAAELRLHRKHGLPGERWNAEMVNVMLKSLTTLKQYEEGPDGEIYEVKGKAFFTDEDIAWIRKHSGTERYKLWAELYGLEAAELAMGIPGLFAAFTKGLVDI